MQQDVRWMAAALDEARLAEIRAEMEGWLRAQGVQV